MSSLGAQSHGALGRRERAERGPVALESQRQRLPGRSPSRGGRPGAHGLSWSSGLIPAFPNTAGRVVILRGTGSWDPIRAGSQTWSGDDQIWSVCARASRQEGTQSSFDQLQLLVPNCLGGRGEKWPALVGTLAPDSQTPTSVGFRP